MNKNYAPPRPVVDGPCTCVWPREFERQEARVQQEEKLHAATSPIIGIINAVSPEKRHIPGSYDPETPGVTPGIEDVTERHLRVPEPIPLPNGNLQPSSVHKPMTKPIYDNATAKRRGDEKRAALQGKQLADLQKPDVVARKVKKMFARSNQGKLADLFSYREDLSVTLNCLVPKHQQLAINERLFNPDTYLCASCATTLQHNMYYSAARFEPYLFAHATRAYLALCDDAKASVDLGLPMESVTHHELERILRGELAVCEWRLSLKLSKFHRKTNYLNLFPVTLGEFAELQVNPLPDPQPESFFTKIRNKGLQGVGLRNIAPKGPKLAE